VSCYKTDYTRSRPQTTTGQITRGNDAQSTLTDVTASQPFEGQSTYASHYVRFNQADRRSLSRPPETQAGLHPFNGVSEYRRHYGDCPLSARTPFVHLEMEETRRLKAAA
jgi:hypothetical protein